MRSPRSLTSPGATVTSRNTSPRNIVPFRGGRPVLEAGDQALDAEPAVAPIRMPGPCAGQDALLSRPASERAVDVAQRQAAARLALVVDDPAR